MLLGSSQRPFGIGVIVVVELFFIMFIIFRLWLANLPDPVISLETAAGVNHYQIIGTIIELFNLVIIYGLWRLRRWAWFLFMITLGMQMLIDITTYFYGQPVYVSMFINIVIVFYLNQQDVQRAFDHQEHK